MTSTVMVGLIALVIGVLGFWQRERISQLNKNLGRRQGKPGELMAEVGTAKYFGIGAIFMALAGAGTVVYALVSGEPAQGNVEDQARLVIIVAAVLFVAMGITVGVLLYRRAKK